jgi:hypothetical protein
MAEELGWKIPFGQAGWLLANACSKHLTDADADDNTGGHENRE